MSKIIIVNNFFFFFNFLSLLRNYYLINNNFYAIVFFFKISNFLKHFFIIKKFHLYSFFYINDIFINFLNKFFFNIFYKLIFINLGFVYYRFFIKIGLGFRKKYFYSKNIFLIYVGKRHWVIFKSNTNFYFNIRRRNILMFSQSKKALNYYSAATRLLRRESLFKTKGVMFKRAIIKRKIPRSILFARRVKFAKIKLKLSKKQKLV